MVSCVHRGMLEEWSPVFNPLPSPQCPVHRLTQRSSVPEPAKDAHWNRQSADRLPPWAQSGPVAPSPAPWVLQSNVPRSRSSGKTRALGGASDERVRPCMPYTSQSAGPAQATVDLALEPRSRQPPADTNIGGGDWTVRELVSGTQTAPAY